MENKKILEKIFKQDEFSEISHLFLRIDIEKNRDFKEDQEEIKFILKELKKIRLEKELQETSQQIKEAEENEDLQRLDELLKKFNTITMELKPD